MKMKVPRIDEYTVFESITDVDGAEAKIPGRNDIYQHVRRETVIPLASGGPARERFSVSYGDHYETFPTWEEACAFYYTLPRTHWIIVLYDDEWDTPLYGKTFTSYEDAWDFLYVKFPSTLPGEGEPELDRHAVIPNPGTSE